jgi:excisionase family DNA binding protein
MTIPKTLSDGELLSTAEVAKQLGVHRSTVWLWIKRDMLPSKKHGAFHGVRPADLKRFLSVYEIVVPRKRKRKRSRKK